ncbi:proline iminopeptidase [Amycolatopsis arida]|uniref:Proline iminopeptidase n=1 Tax=Amycolatopsis arida TaxID=587909 RepID=A0A1I6AZX0_9PSEU|nr:prolyl aminopeptidase [Amycolatopsis arida]TDX92170.1 proline iminopeptidase [Amycolatopsis arida]SFQ74183.1 proline iminopeptidase [Amycolatopsis arida]
MTDLYPPIQPYARGMLEVDAGIAIYWETSGNPDGKPVVVLHGGPGSGSAPLTRQHFDPAAYRIVLFDQRGAGRSTPAAGAPGADPSRNTTWHLVADLERLREHLRIERWQVFGGSWGATLGLAYAQTHPERVSEIVLRGVFTARQRELDWIYRGGAGNLFPEDWERFLAALPAADRADPLAGYHRLVFDPDPAVSEPAAVAWSGWEGAIVSAVPQQGFRTGYARPAFAVPFARLALRYFAHGAWLEPDQLLRDAGKLAGIPGAIVQGRYDVVCPPVTAYELHRAWPDAELSILPHAGHAVTDPGVLAGLRAATDRFRPQPGPTSRNQVKVRA